MATAHPIAGDVWFENTASNEWTVTLRRGDGSHRQAGRFAHLGDAVEAAVAVRRGIRIGDPRFLALIDVSAGELRS